MSPSFLAPCAVFLTGFLSGAGVIWGSSSFSLPGDPGWWGTAFLLYLVLMALPITQASLPNEREQRIFHQREDS